MRLLKWTLIFAFMLVVVVVASPFAMRFYVEDNLAERGIEGSIKSVGVNIFTGRLTFKGVKLGQSEKDTVKFGELKAKIGLLALFADELHFQELSARDVEIHYSQTSAKHGIFAEQLDHFLSRLAGGKLFTVDKFALEDVELCRYIQLSGKNSQMQCMNFGSLYTETLALNRTGNKWRYDFGPRMIVRRAYLQDETHGLSVFYLGEANLEGVIVSPGKRTVRRGEFINFQLVETGDEQAPELFSRFNTQFGRLVLSNLNYSASTDKALSISDVLAESWRQSVHRGPTGEFIVVEKLKDFFPVSQSDDEGVNGLMQVKIGKMRFVDGAVVWYDQAVSPTASEKIARLHLDLSEIDSLKPEQDVQINLKAEAGKINGILNVRGKVRPFAKGFPHDLAIGASGLDMAKLSAYASEILGQKVHGGEFSSQFKSISDGSELALDGIARIARLDLDKDKNVKFKRTDVTDLYDLLKNARGAIEFSAEIKHDLTADSSLNDSLAKAFQEVLYGIANRSYLAGDKNNPVDSARARYSIQLEPFYFALSEETLSDKYNGRMAAVMRLASSGDSLLIDACPVATAGEWSSRFNSGQALRDKNDVSFKQLQELIDLSLSRFQTIRQELRDSGVPSRRINDCRPQVDLKESGPSYVEISMR